jgi:predicted enzyme related to lactoylglutathione lyase
MKFIQTGFSLLIIFGLMAVLSGCVSAPKDQQATETAVASATSIGKWQRFDLVSDNVKEASQFYAAVFGWQFQQTTDDSAPYYLATVDGQPVAGFATFKRRPESYRRAVWINYLSVASVNTAIEQITRQQGRLILDKREVEGISELAVVADPEGGVFGLMPAKAQSAEVEVAGENRFVWSELWADDLDRMAAFYAGLADYEVESYNSVDDHDEIVLTRQGQPRASMIHVARESEVSAWLPYVRVSNLQQTLSRVAQANGEILVMPSAEIRNGKVAVVKDAQGAAVGLLEWPPGEALEVAK